MEKQVQLPLSSLLLFSQQMWVLLCGQRIVELELEMLSWCRCRPRPQVRVYAVWRLAWEALRGTRRYRVGEYVLGAIGRVRREDVEAS